MFQSNSYEANDVVKGLWGFTAAFAVVSLLVTGMLASSARAEPSPCRVFDKGLELNDGSVVAADSNCLAKFRADGQPDPAFGQDGISRLELGAADGSERIVDLFKLSDGFLVVRTGSILLIAADGTQNPAFAEDGYIDADEVLGQDGWILDATADDQGDIFVTGFQKIAKLLPSGVHDLSFGEDGISQGETPPGHNLPFDEIEVDDQGRLLVAGNANIDPLHLNAEITRMSPSGAIDPSFGDAGMAYSQSQSPTAVQSGITLDDISIGTAGRILLLGNSDRVFAKGGESKTYWASFGADGEPIAVSPENIPTSAPAQAELPDGDLILPDGVFRRIHPDGSDAQPGTKIDPAKLSEGGYRARSVSFNPSTGNVLSAGELREEPYCGHPVCEGSRAGVVKINADTGEAVQGFGVNGAAIASPNECPKGDAAQITGYGPWSRCLLARPAVRAKVGIGHGRSRRPSVRMTLDLESTIKHPFYLTQRFKIKLPERLKLSKGWKSRMNIRFSGLGITGKAFRTVSTRRLIRIRFKPAAGPPEYPDESTSNYGWPEPVDPTTVNPAIRAKIKFKRGAVKRFPKKLRGKRLHVVVSGQVAAGTEEALPWWGGSKWTKRSVRLKVP